jgi:3-hydroxybutyryl-CoA dehydrogenase
MDIDNIKNVSVIGAGGMGSQLTQILSLVGGFNVTMTDVKQEIVTNGIGSIKSALTKHFVEKGKMTNDQMCKVMERIKGTASISDAVKSADFVIEAAFESMEVKKNIFRQLSEHAPSHTILSTNTSFLNISEMASATNRPDRVIGMHFFNPVSVMKLVEVVKGTLTSKNTTDTTFELAKKLGKEPIVCKDFSFGFLANRAYIPMQIEGIKMVWECVAPPADIDKALKLGYNLPIGPLELGDMVGTWALLASSEDDKCRELGDQEGHLHPLIRMMIRAGFGGGRGKKGVYAFYDEIFSQK